MVCKVVILIIGSDYYSEYVHAAVDDHDKEHGDAKFELVAGEVAVCLARITNEIIIHRHIQIFLSRRPHQPQTTQNIAYTHADEHNGPQINMSLFKST